MSIQEKAHVNTGFPEIGKKRKNSLELNRALDETVDWFLEKYPITKRFTATFFMSNIEDVNDDDVKFFESYTRLAIKQILVGALQYRFWWNRNHKTMLKALEEKDPYKLNEASFDDEIFHEVAHSIFALIASFDKRKIKNLMPEFQRRHFVGIFSLRSWREELMVNNIVFEEYGVRNNKRGARGNRVYKEIQKSSDAREFIYKLFNLDEIPIPFNLFNRMIVGNRFTNRFWGTLNGVYKNYGDNPRYILDLFTKNATPIVRKYQNT